MTIFPKAIRILITDPTNLYAARAQRVSLLTAPGAEDYKTLSTIHA
jgi:hypothetical protein